MAVVLEMHPNLLICFAIQELVIHLTSAPVVQSKIGLHHLDPDTTFSGLPNLILPMLYDILLLNALFCWDLDKPDLLD